MGINIGDTLTINHIFRRCTHTNKCLNAIINCIRNFIIESRCKLPYRKIHTRTSRQDPFTLLNIEIFTTLQKPDVTWGCVFMYIFFSYPKHHHKILMSDEEIHQNLLQYFVCERLVILIINKMLLVHIYTFWSIFSASNVRTEHCIVML